jgi:C1A family cysteine protease
MKKSLHAHGVALGVALACLLCMPRPAWALEDPTYFDWRDVEGKDYTTPIRSQSVDGEYYAGTCWAFGVVASFESKLEICYDDPDWNPDLSEQHMICDGTAGNSTRGWEYKALQFLVDTGIVTEEELPYTAEDDSPYWPLAEGWEDRVYTITGYEKLLDVSTDNVKTMLRTCGPLVASMYTPDDWIPRPDSAPPTSAEPTGGVNHTVSVIGYMDDDLIDGGGYWIIKNSWGTGYGDNGYYYIPYGVLESHNRLYAITGQAIAPVPEPATMGLLGIGVLAILRRRRK